MIPSHKIKIAEQISDKVGPCGNWKRRRSGLKEAVIEFAEKIPEATTRDVADYLDCDTAYVRDAQKRYGLNFSRWVPEYTGSNIYVYVSGDIKNMLADKAVKQNMSLSRFVTNVMEMYATGQLKKA